MTLDSASLQSGMRKLLKSMGTDGDGLKRVLWILFLTLVCTIALW